MSKPIVHTHWLFGRGPNKVLDFKHPVAVETKCADCIHTHVCSHVMERRCVNYTCGTSDGSGCHSCSHRFTRFDDHNQGKDAVPCFHCKEFLPNKAAGQKQQTEQAQ